MSSAQQQKIHHQAMIGRGQTEGKSQPDPRGKKKPAKQNTHQLDTGEQLLEAASQGKTKIVKRLLDTHASTNFANAVGETPLMKACSLAEDGARPRITALLLAKGCNIDHQDSSRQTALMKAVQSQDKGLVKELLSHNADITLEDYEGNTALCHAAITGNTDIIKTILVEWKRHKLPIDCKNMRGLTPLLLAAQNGHLQGAELLVEMGGASSTIRDLDNFMTAGEWLKQSSFCTADDIKFLSPLHIRHRKHKKRVKTLSDYLDDGLTASSSPDMYKLKHDLDKNSFNLPVIKSHAQSHDPPASRKQFSNTGTKSMFDLPTIATSFSSAISPHDRTVPELRQVDGIPRSRAQATNYLAKRKTFLNPNRRGKFYAEGSLEPLQSGPNPKKLSRMNSFCEDSEELNLTMDLRRSGTLPPLEPELGKE